MTAWRPNDLTLAGVPFRKVRHRRGKGFHFESLGPNTEAEWGRLAVHDLKLRELLALSRIPGSEHDRCCEAEFVAGGHTLCGCADRQSWREAIL